MTKLLLLPVFLILSLHIFSQTTEVNAVPKYSWNATDLPNTFNEKLQFSFVRSNQGFPGFGTVLAGGPTNVGSDGGAFQMYFPYNNSNGGVVPRIRLGKHPTNGWSEWDDFYTSANANNLTSDWRVDRLFVNGNITNMVGSGSTITLFEDDDTRKNRIIIGADGDGAFLTSTFGTGGTDAISFRGAGSSKIMTLTKQDHVGIGNSNPDMKLSVQATDKYVSRFHSTDTESIMTGIRIGRKKSIGASYADLVNLNNGFGIAAGYSGSNLPLNTQDISTIAIFTSYNTKNVGIGTIDPGIWKLAVNGEIRAKEIKVETGWSDFVFEKDYKLPTLQEVEEHIKEKGHLQDIPSGKEVEENGIFLGEMNSKLLQKIEELMLYTIEQQKEIELLKLNNESFRSELQNLKKQ